MKTNIVAALLILTLLSCKQKDTDETEKSTADTITVAQPDAEVSAVPTAGKAFDPTTIAVTEKLTGDFPYIQVPEGYTLTDPNKYHGKGQTKDVDREYFYNDGYYFPIDGKSFKAVFRVDENAKDKTFSKLEIQKSLDKSIANLGGVKINNGKPVANGEKDRLEKETPNAYSDGYMHSAHNYDDVHTYAMRTKDELIFVQYNLGSESAHITVITAEE